MMDDKRVDDKKRGRVSLFLQSPFHSIIHHPLLHPQFLILLALGFSSGLPFALTASTLSLWLAEAGISKTSIGLFGGIGIAYAFKFAWSPLADHFRLPLLSRFFGRRRAWLLLTQGMLLLSLLALSAADPAQAPLFTALFALLTAFFSATQDIVFDAYRVESLPPEKQADGAAVAVLGYRLGLIVSSAGSLYLATSHGWHVTYQCMAALMGVGLLAALLAREPAAPTETHAQAAPRLTWFIEPVREFFLRPGWLVILAFVFFYKLPDAFMSILANPYYREIGFSKIQIADVAKIYGFFASIGGGFLGAWMVRRFGLSATLWIGGIACAATNLLFIPLQTVGPDTAWLAGIITLDNLSGGVSVTALVAYLSGLCNRQFTATQYALLSSLIAAARTASSMPAGWCAEAFGWTAFFTFSALLAVPGLLALAVLARRRGL